MTNPTTTQRGLGRRGFLVAGGASALLGLAGCGGGGGSDSSGAHTDLIKIPKAKVKLPTGDTEFRLLDSGDTKKPFWEQFFDAYKAKHPNIKTTYDPLPWNRIQEVVPLGIRNGTAHDVLQLPSTIPLPQAVQQGWVAPLDDVIPDFAAWKKSFPDTVFAEGMYVFDGKTYSTPLSSDQRHYALLHYNKQLMDQADYDPAAEPFTWDTFRKAAKKITKQGRGRTYGLVLEVAQPDRLSYWVDYLARSAGGYAAVSAGTGGPWGIDLRTGEYAYDRPEVVEAIELMLAMKSDGSILPGSSSLTAPEAWPRVVQGNAAMVLAGPWVAVEWETQNKGFEFGIASHPVADKKNGHAPGYSVFGTDQVVVFSGSKAKAVAGDVLSYVTSVGGQKAWGDVVGVGNPPINEEAREAIKKTVSKQSRACLEQAEKMVANPAPEIRNPDVARALAEMKAVTPTFGQVIQAAFVGKGGNLRKALRGLESRSNRALDDAIKAARKKGAKVSREDWVFKNWDPKKPYEKKDYDAL